MDDFAESLARASANARGDAPRCRRRVADSLSAVWDYRRARDSGEPQSPVARAYTDLGSPRAVVSSISAARTVAGRHLADMLPDDPTLLVAVSESSAVIAPDRDERRSQRDLAPSERIVATLAAAPGAPSSR